MFDKPSKSEALLETDQPKVAMHHDRPRILVFQGNDDESLRLQDALSHAYDIDQADRPEQGLTMLREREYHAVVAAVGDFLPLERALVGDKASLVLNTIGEGVCIVDADGRVSWSNAKMRRFEPGVFEQTRRIGRQALQIFAAQSGPLDERSPNRSRKFTFQSNERYFELICSPTLDESGRVQQVVAVVWDATSGKRLQSKIDAIDASGRELAKIDADAVAKLSPSERLKLLQDKIIKYSKDLMHFDHFAIRLLDKRTNRLEVVIAEGLPPEALEIDLYAEPEGNGITGYVGATRRSYICHDTEKDPRYVLGLRHCKSSLTVPLMLNDEVIGVYNVESARVGAFTEDDRQFAEIFARPVAQALRILDLLVVERCTTSGQITDNVVQEMAQPLNDILAESQTLMEQYIGDDAMRDRLNTIVNSVESIRHSIRDVAAGPKAVLGADCSNDESQSKPLAGKRILIADDEPNIRETIADVLRKQGAEVVAAKNGHEACTALEADDAHFDLVLSDIKMPYRNGYEIFAQAKRYHEGVPVLLMTGFGYDPHHSIVRATQEGLQAVLFKPFKVDQLFDEVFSAMGMEKPAASGTAS